MITLDMHTMEIEDATEAVGELPDITGLDEFADHPSFHAGAVLRRLRAADHGSCRGRAWRLLARGLRTVRMRGSVMPERIRHALTAAERVRSLTIHERGDTDAAST